MFKFLLKIFGFSADAGKDAKPEVKTLDQARGIITALRASIEKIGAKFFAAGQDIDAHMESGDDSLKDAFAAAETKGKAELATATARIATLEADLAAQQAEATSFKADRDTAKASLATVTAQVTLLTTSLASAGVKLPVATAEKPLDQSGIVASLESYGSLKARERLAKHGINDPIPAEPAADSTKPAAEKKELKGLARVEAAFKAKSSGKN
jgi:hypothetical protein